MDETKSVPGGRIQLTLGDSDLISLDLHWLCSTAYSPTFPVPSRCCFLSPPVNPFTGRVATKSRGLSKSLLLHLMQCTRTQEQRGSQGLEQRAPQGHPKFGTTSHTTGSSRKNGKSKTVCTGILFHKSWVFSAVLGPKLATNLSSTAPRSTTINQSHP